MRAMRLAEVLPTQGSICLAHYGNIGIFGGLSSNSLCEAEEDIGVGRIVQSSGCCMFHRVLSEKSCQVWNLLLEVVEVCELSEAIR